MAVARLEVRYMRSQTKPGIVGLLIGEFVDEAELTTKVV